MQGSDISDIPVVLLGLGPVGQAIARVAVEEPGLRVVGAVDPLRVGERLSVLIDAPSAPALVVEGDTVKVLTRARGGVALHEGSGSLAEALPDLELAAKAGVSVVSACPDVAFPWLGAEEEAAHLDAAFAAAEVALVGVGSIPGLALDRLPALLSQQSGPVRHVKGLRAIDAATCREELRRRAGLGLSEADFQAAADAGEVGLDGLSGSAMLAALGCGFELDEVEEELSPLLAEEDGPPGAVTLRAGQVVGLHQLARGFVAGEERVLLELVLSAGAENTGVELVLDGRSPVKLRLEGGLPGDEGTAWAVVHAAASIANLRGLVTALDLPSGR